MRQVVLDTETTGLEPSEGHRIIEIGAVELLDRRLTGRTYHQYIKPDRDIDLGAIAVHGITAEFLADKPSMAEVVDEFIAFVEGAELIIHNARFDVGFINHEFFHLPKKLPRVDRICQILDTLSLAREKHPGQRNSLDALCQRYHVSNAHRKLHGALLDAQLLAEVYLAMTGGQRELFADEPTTMPTPSDNPAVSDWVGNSASFPTTVIRADAAETAAHDAMLEKIKATNGQLLWSETAR